MRAEADKDGFVGLSVDDLVERVPSKAGDRKIGAALRVLGAAGAVAVEPAAAGRVWVRLLAAPARITRELTGDREYDREVLRALWRAAGCQVCANERALKSPSAATTISAIAANPTKRFTFIVAS